MFRSLEDHLELTKPESQFKFLSKKKLNSFLFSFSSCKSLISSLHILNIFILVITASIRKNFILIVIIINIFSLYSFLYFPSFLSDGISPTPSFFLKFLFMLQIIFEFLVKYHTIQCQRYFLSSSFFITMCGLL